MANILDALGDQVREAVECRNAIVPLASVSPADVLYGARQTTWRFEVLNHQPMTGRGTLAGYLDGVESASLRWTAFAAVKGRGEIEVRDLDEAREGYLRARDVNMFRQRIRPVMCIEGLPEIPWGEYIITAAPEEWESTGKVYSIELHDKLSALEQDRLERPVSVNFFDRVLFLVRHFVQQGGEDVAVDLSDAVLLGSQMTWLPGTSRLTIINDLLSAIGYSSLWMDGQGDLRATPHVLPGDRPLTYDVLGIPRELVHGEMSVYSPTWVRDRDLFRVPNRVIAVETGTGEREPLIGVAENTNPESPTSRPSRGRWITHVLDNVDVPEGNEEERQNFLDTRAKATLIAMSAVQASVSVTALPLPLGMGDAVRFQHTPAGIDARHVVVGAELNCTPTGLMTIDMQEVVADL